MNAQELMLEAMRTFHYGAKTSEEYALLTCLPVDTCDAILRSMPWYVGLNLYSIQYLRSGGCRESTNAY